MNKRLLILLPIAFIALALSIWLLFFRQGGIVKDAYSAVPDNPIFLYTLNESNWDKKSWDTLLDQYGSFPLLQDVTQKLNNLHAFYETVTGITLKTDADVLLTGFVNGNASPNLLLVFTIDNGRKWKIDENIGPLNSLKPLVKERLVNKEKLLEITYPGSPLRFSAFQAGELLIISESAFLVENAITALNSKERFSQSAGFATIKIKMEQSGNPVFYFNMRQLGAYMDAVDAWKFPKSAQAFNDIVEWVGFTVQQVSGMLVFDGFAVSGEDGTWLLDNYIQTASGKSEITSVLPSSTMFYWERLPGVTPEILLAANPESKIEFDAYFKNWIGDNWATAMTFSIDTGIQVKTACVIKARNISDAFNLLSANADPIEQNYRSVPFNRLAPSAVLNMLSGMQDSTYYAAINNYLVFCTSLSQLKTFIDANLSRRTLSERSTFVSADSAMLSSWNQLFFFDLAALSDILIATDSLDRPFSKNLSPLFIQLNQSNGVFLLNGYLLNYSKNKDDVMGSWIAETEYAITAGPFVLYNQLTGADCVAVQDSMHHLYLIDANGEIIWKRLLTAPIIGQVTTVDFYSNQRYQLLFSTRDAIQLIDMKGNDVEGFPIRLTSEVVSGMSVIDYEQNGDYRMFVGCNNGNMYGFYKNGKPLQGWKPLKSGLVSGTLEHIVSGGADYLFFRQSTGKLVVKNRKGEDRFSPVNLPADLITDLVPDRNSDPTALVSLDKSGNLHTIQFNGTASNKPFAQEVTSAVMGDIDGDGNTDVVYSNTTGVFAVNLKGEVIYTFDPGDPLAYRVSILRHKNSSKVIVSSHETGNTYLLNPQGEPAETDPFAISGNTAWSNNPVSLFIIASGRLLQSFQIE